MFTKYFVFKKQQVFIDKYLMNVIKIGSPLTKVMYRYKLQALLIQCTSSMIHISIKTCR